MKSETTESEVVDESTVAKKPRLSLVVILAMLLGALLMVGLGATLLHLQSSKAARGEVLALKKELKEKGAAYESLIMQMEALSGQVELLKENAVARSSGAGESHAEAGGAAPAETIAETSTKPTSVAEKTAPPEPSPPKTVPLEPVLPETAPTPRTKKPKSDKPNCALVGKSKEEQEETLKRCISLIDPPK